MNEKDQKDQLTVPESESIAPEASGGDSESKNRRQFLTAGLGALAAGAAVTAAAVTSTSRRSTTNKSKILARIQEELDKEYLNDPLTYHTTGYNEYVKGS